MPMPSVLPMPPVPNELRLLGAAGGTGGVVFGGVGEDGELVEDFHAGSMQRRRLSL